MSLDDDIKKLQQQLANKKDVVEAEDEDNGEPGNSYDPIIFQHLAILL